MDTLKALMRENSFMSMKENLEERLPESWTWCKIHFLEVTTFALRFPCFTLFLVYQIWKRVLMTDAKEITVAWGEAGLEQSLIQPSIDEGLLEKLNKELNQLQRLVDKPQSKNM